MSAYRLILVCPRGSQGFARICVSDRGHPHLQQLATHLIHQKDKLKIVVVYVYFVNTAKRCCHPWASAAQKMLIAHAHLCPEIGHESVGRMLCMFWLTIYLLVLIGYTNSSYKESSPRMIIVVLFIGFVIRHS